jgi:hypothetical protein
MQVIDICAGTLRHDPAALIEPGVLAHDLSGVIDIAAGAQVAAEDLS